MAIRKYLPTSPARRHYDSPDFADVAKQIVADPKRRHLAYAHVAENRKRASQAIGIDQPLKSFLILFRRI